MEQKDVDKLLSEKLEDGEHVSPVLPGGIKNYLIERQFITYNSSVT